MALTAVADDLMEPAVRSGPQPGSQSGPSFGLVWATGLVLPLGAVEGWYGKTVAGDLYGSDAVQYLDIARAFERGDVHSALNPLWGQGYPALLALVRPLFRAGLEGEWNAIRSLNFTIFVFSWLAFVGLLRELLRGRERRGLVMAGAAFVFVTMQVLVDQVSRVGPDQLVAALFFVACTVLLRLLHTLEWRWSAALGLVLGLGFLTKAIFLPLGCVALAIAAAGLRGRWRTLVPAGVVFAAMVLSYGAALSWAVGKPTLGEAGSLNYAWHVNRLRKWVHWQGGAEPAEQAWPKPWIARFTHWQSDPPDFGRPVHPDALAGSNPTIYVFHAPVQATYVPYFEPSYWYQGYRHLVRWRYQVIALGKNVGDLTKILVAQPLFWTFCLSIAIVLWARRLVWPRTTAWPIAGLALAGVAIYLPVHLEGRYVAAFLAVLGVVLLDGMAARLEATPSRRAMVLALLAAGFVAGLVKDQRDVWARVRGHWDYRANLEWREGRVLAAAGLSPASEIGVIAWQANVQCDWAYLAEVRITSEIASARDEKVFWNLDAMDRNAVLLRFRQAGAVAVVTRDAPPGAAPGWAQLGDLPMWMYRF